LPSSAKNDEAAQAANGSEIPLYEQPVKGDVYAAQPRSIRELAEGTPLFPPVESLPV